MATRRYTRKSNIPVEVSFLSLRWSKQGGAKEVICDGGWLTGIGTKSNSLTPKKVPSSLDFACKAHLSAQLYEAGSNEKLMFTPKLIQSCEECGNLIHKDIMNTRFRDYEETRLYFDTSKATERTLCVILVQDSKLDACYKRFLITFSLEKTARSWKNEIEVLKSFPRCKRFLKHTSRITVHELLNLYLYATVHGMSSLCKKALERIFGESRDVVHLHFCALFGRGK